MAVTSLWAVRGNLGGVLDYAANPEKTDLMNLLRYATQQRKTTVQEEGTPEEVFAAPKNQRTAAFFSKVL